MKRLSDIRVPRGLILAVMVMFATFVVLSVLSPGASPATAQEEEPTAVPTPTPLFGIALNRVLAEDGDLDGDGAVDPGDTLQYSVSVSNDGQQDSGPVEVVVRLDNTLVGTVTDISDGGSQGEAGEVIWSFENIEGGQSVDVAFNAALRSRFPSGRSQLSSTAVVRSAGGVELARGGALPLEVVGPILKITEVRSEVVTDANESGRLDAGDTVRLTIAYANTGAGPSQEATLSSDYREDMVAQIVGIPDDGVDDGSAVMWTVGSVPAGGETREVQYDLQLVSELPAGETTLPITTTILSGGVERDSSELQIDLSGASLTIETDVSFTLDQNANQLGNSGDEVRFEIVFANVGDEPAASVNVTADYNERFLEALDAADGGQIDAEVGTVTWTIPEIGAGQRATLTFDARLGSLPEGLPVINTSVRVESPDAPVTEAQRAIQLDTEVAVQPTPSGPPTVTEQSPAQGQGILPPVVIGVLLGAFLFFSLLSIGFITSRVLDSSEPPDTDKERDARRRLVREIIEGVVLTLILFAVMMLGLQNALDKDSVNSIIAGIVGYVAGRVASQN